MELAHLSGEFSGKDYFGGRGDGLFKADVDMGETTVAGMVGGGQRQAGDLGQCFGQKDAGDEGLAGEVAGEEGFGSGDLPEALGGLAGCVGSEA